MLLAPPRPAPRLRPSARALRRAPARPALPALPVLSRRTQGQLLAVTAFAASAAGQVLAKHVYAAGAAPASFLVIRLAAAVAVLAVLRRGMLLALPARRIATLLALGVGFGAQTLAFFSALERAPVALVVVVVTAYPVVVVLLDAVVARTAPPPRRLATLALALVGLWLAAGSPSGAPDAGVWLALLSAVGYGAYLRLSAPALTDVRPMVATAWVLTGALVTVGVVAAVTGPTWPTATGWVLAGVHGAVATTVPIVAVYAAIQRLGAAEVSGLGPLEPILATGFAVALLGERLDAGMLVGGLVVVAAVAQLAGMRPRFGLPRLPIALPRVAGRASGQAPARERTGNLRAG